MKHGTKFLITVWAFITVLGSVLSPVNALSEITDPNVKIRPSAPEGATSMVIYEGEYSPQQIDFEFVELGNIFTQYNHSSVVCTDDENRAVIREYVDYDNFEYKTYLYDGDSDSYTYLDAVHPIYVSSCQFVGDSIYLVGRKETKVNGQRVGKFYLYELNMTLALIRSKEWDPFDDNCTFCGPTEVFVDGQNIYVLVLAPGTILKLSKSFGEISSVEIPEYKWTYNGAADSLRSMWKTGNGKYWVSSDLALWEFREGVFVHEYLRDDRFDLAETTLGYNSNRFGGRSGGGNDFFLNTYNGTLFKYDPTASVDSIFTKVDEDSRSYMSSFYYNDKEWFMHMPPSYGSFSKVLVGYNPKTGEKTNLSAKFSQFDKSFNKGFRVNHNFVFANGKIYRMQFGQRIAAEIDFTLSATQGLKTVTIDYYNNMGHFVGSETFQYELVNPTIPYVEDFKLNKPEDCSEIPYFSWSLKNGSKVNSLKIIVNGTDEYVIDDIAEEKYSLTKYYPGVSTAVMEMGTTDGNTYYSEEIKFEFPEIFAKLTHINDEEYVPEFDEDGRQLPIVVHQNDLSLSGDINAICGVQILYNDNLYFFEANVDGDEWSWGPLALPNRDYEIIIIGNCWNFESYEKITVTIDGSEDVPEPDWENIAEKRETPIGDELYGTWGGAPEEEAVAQKTLEGQEALENERAERAQQASQAIKKQNIILGSSAGGGAAIIATAAGIKFKGSILAVLKRLFAR